MTYKIPVTIYAAAKSSADTYPDRFAYDFMGLKSTYRDFIKEIDTCASALIFLGIGSGDIVSAYLPNMPFSLVLFYAVNKIGAVTNFIHPLLPIDDHIDLLKEMAPKAIFMLDSFHEKLAGLKARGIKSRYLLIKTSRYLPLYAQLLYKLKESAFHRHINFDDNTRYFKFSGSTSAVKDPKQRSDDKTALILFTGGTTGKSKGVCLSDKNVNANAAQTVSFQKKSDEPDRMLSILPVFHGYGLVACIHTAVLAAAQVLLLPYYKDRLFKNTIIKKKPNYIIGVPRLYSRMTRVLSDTDIDLTFFRGLYCGGAALSESVLQAANRLLKDRHSPVVIQEGYGLTECVSACTLTPEGQYRRGSIGKPYPGVKVKIRSLDSGEPLIPGESGEICINSDTVMIGYYNSNSPNIGNENGEKWLYTGDVGYMDEDGFLYFTDRMKRMVKIAGYEVFPAAVEAIINSITGISNCCVIESSHNGLAYLKAFIVCNSKIEKQELVVAVKATCSEKLPGYSIPGEFEFIDSIPETLMKKNDYRSLS